MIELSKKESQILSLINRHGYVTGPSILPLVKQYPHIYTYLGKLAKKELIKKVEIDKKNLYLFSEKGLRLASEFTDDFIAFHPKHIRKDQIRHTTFCIKIDIHFNYMNYFDKYQSSEYISDRYLHSDTQSNIDQATIEALGEIRIPDAQCVLTSSTQHLNCAIECELTKKSRARYKSIFDFYNATSRYDKVFWFVDSEPLLTSILNTIKDLARQTIASKSDAHPIANTIAYKHRFFLCDEFFDTKTSIKDIPLRNVVLT